MKLEPKTITIGSDVKFFSKEGGRSAGSLESCTFGVTLEEGDTKSSIARTILEVRREMDRRLLLLEFLRGNIDADRYNVENDILEARYARIFGIPCRCAEEDVEKIPGRCASEECVRVAKT